jgi:CRISPR-associated endonuclease/helicase Cas3
MQQREQNMSDAIPFDAAFRALTGHNPFPWQRSLYDRLAQGDIPRSCDIPTGLGKTAVVAIWLIALANHPDRLFRRLVYVVNRRTVVDQSTAEVERIRKRLNGEADLPSQDRGVLQELRRLLGRLCATNHDEVLAISTLRGKFADNQEWCADPSRPAVIVGTVDMIGSRLLFSGYRIGFKSRPLHAGFLGQDALLVHDEAHLEPAFQKLVEAIEKEQNEGERTNRLPWPKLRVMALTATSRDYKQNGQAFELTPEETNPPETLPEPRGDEPSIHCVWRRLRAIKALRLHKTTDGKGAVAKKIAALAAKYKDSNAAVLVFVRTLDDIDSVAKEVAKTKRSTLLLTGTMRGKERDELVEKPAFKRFLKDAQAAETVYLLCTSAGEVGIDISADHNMVCDLSTFESMAQRLGRVNRFGHGDARIDVVYPAEFDEKDKLSPARENTLKLLQQLPRLPQSEDHPGVARYDASPKALAGLKDRADLPCEIDDAYSPKPTILDTTDVLFDAWAMTTIRGQMPGRPAVAPYLHGVADWEPAETHVAWREEVGILTDEALGRYDPREMLEHYPLKPHELLRDRSDRVFATLQMLAAKHPTEPVWVVDERGNVEVHHQLGELANPSATNAQARAPLVARIEGRTILLPPIVGGLRCGMLDGTSEDADDVADIAAPETERRARLWSNDKDYSEKTAGMRLVYSVDLGREEPDDSGEAATWDWYKHKPLEDARTAKTRIRWHDHVADVLRRIDRVLARLSLPTDIERAVRVATSLHDHGKRRLHFQSTLGNREYPAVVLAKSGRSGAKLPETYRHEFGSLADTMEDAEFRQLSSEMQELALHLIATSHGRGRPHFPSDEVFDPERPQSDARAMAANIPRRFARLQRRYGRWGLAYLESLLRAADWAASAEPSEPVAETKQEVSR